MPRTPAPIPTGPGWVPPTEFDEFRLVRVLGQGAMGVVYLAHDRSLDRQVAVKFIATTQPDAEARAHFQVEARAIARLQHPNVVTVFRVGGVEGHPYLVSEYLIGQSLAELAPPLPWRRVLSLGVGLARGLSAAHRQGVLHRDIKPSNVFLTAEGEVKLLDFGMAELADTSTPGGAENDRALWGTPRYMAPELFSDISATPRSDIYSLGMVLYELCTGALPRRRRQPSPRALGAQPGQGPSALTERVPGIDPEFAALIERCLNPDPSERFASAEALFAALERLEQPLELSALAAGNPYRGLAPFEAEHRSLFFGRDADIRAVLERLRYQSLVLVAGDSGVGKSSLCRAGILPRITQGALDEHRPFSILTLWPGLQPLAALTAALAPLLGQTEAELGALLAESPEQLGSALRKAYKEGKGLLLFIDQFEELVTLSDPDQAVRFSRLLGDLSLPSPGVRVLLTVRGDFLARLGALPGLGVELERALYLLRPLTPEGMREAIVGPARSQGVVFESEALLQTLLASTAQGVGSLPLLQFTLAELWERRNTAQGLITQAALEEMGGVAGALSRHADGVLARLSQAERQAACRMLVRLVTAEGTRAELSEEELTSASQEARAALHALVQGRLLHARTAGDRARLEIAHEALIASWGTLRALLKEDESQRVLRQRVEVASAEWERMARAEDLLWGERQLAEVQHLDAAALGLREQAFLQSSRGTARRRRLRRRGAILVLLLAAAAIYGGPRVQAYRDTRRFVHERLHTAQEARAVGQAHARSALARRDEALALFEGPRASGPVGEQASREHWQQAEGVWRQSLEERELAEAAQARAERALEEALERQRDEQEVKQLHAELTYERLLLAEGFYQRKESAQFLQRLMRMDGEDSAWRNRLEAPAVLELRTAPPGASVELLRYVDEHGVLRRQPVPDLAPLGATPIARLQLPAGSYHLRLRHDSHEPVDLPLVLTRGEQARMHLALPAAVPQGTVYIPPGCSLLGSADAEEVREFLRSVPLRRVCLPEGYLIGRTEVTLGEWVEYLDTLPADAPARHLLAKPSFGNSGALALRQLPSGEWSFSFYLVSGTALTARAGEPLRYPGRTYRDTVDWRRLPLTGISPEDAADYLAWLDRSGRLPGARLCSEYEWERAARGADGRRYPHGNRLQPDDANIDVTYGRRPDAFGPDEVGSHPASASPFGVLDMAGNAFEPTQPRAQDLGGIVLRGGAWYFEQVGALVTNRQAGTPTMRDVVVGLRVCAPWAKP
jgi:formylglycine-generating enzyme required for sulfatase activity